MKDKIIIYTDGACSNNQNKDRSVGGWAYYLEYNNTVKKDSGHVITTTNNRMELLAVINALKSLDQFDIPIVVNSDSTYVVNTINLNWKKNKNLDLWQELLSLISLFDDIKFLKVKGHSSNSLNNLVDKMAVEETLKGK